MTNPNCSWTTTESNCENGSDNIRFESIRNDVMVWVFRNGYASGCECMKAPVCICTGKTIILMNGDNGSTHSVVKVTRYHHLYFSFLWQLFFFLKKWFNNLMRIEDVLPHPLRIEGAPPTLQYADNTLIEMQSKPWLILQQILESFTSFSGLKVNYHKSTVVPIYMT